MKTVKEVSRLTGISIRTLRYYDEIGLLIPTQMTEAGYRLYDDCALAKLEEILFFKEMDISLQDIKLILENPAYDKEQLLIAQKLSLEHKRNRLNGIIELIDDRLRGGVNNMDFKKFTEDDARKIFEHSLQVQTKESLDAIMQYYGSMEQYWEAFSAELMNEEKSAQLIKLYGSKDKAVDASLSASGNPDDFTAFQKNIDNIYHQFSALTLSDAPATALNLVAQLSENYKAMFHLDSAKAMLLEVARDYLGNGLLVDATNKQYGDGVAEYIGQKILEYYGV